MEPLITLAVRARPAVPPTIADADRDALHVLPLATVVIDTPALRRARLIKNAQLDSVVELFSDQATGSGQVEIPGLARELGWPDQALHPDHALLRKLSRLPSFDVYSLRILFREQGIGIASDSALNLSPRKVQELSVHMTRFTRRLIQEVYRSDAVDLVPGGDVLALFRNPDIRMVQQRLKTMADRLGVGIVEIPKFLEDYGDVFLSLSYYRDCLDRIVPTVERFLESLHGLKKNFQLSRDAKFMQSCEFIEATVNGLLSSITGRFESFDRHTDTIWTDLTAEKFRRVEALIRSHHTTVGGVLCALSVKMNAWARLFPNPAIGGPLKRSEFVMSDMRQGLDRIRLIEDSGLQAVLNAG